MVKVAHQRRNSNTACLDSENPVHLHATEPLLYLVRNLPHDINVDLMIQEPVNFQNVARFDNPVSLYFLFKEIHALIV